MIINMTNPKIHMEIDNREHSLICLIRGKDTPLKTICTYSNLDVGDIKIKYNDQIIYIIERKTWSDLAASIKDGRYKSQKLRLLRHTLNNQLNRSSVLYLLEGTLTRKYIEGLSCSTLYSACVNMQTRDGFRIYQTRNVEESFTFLLKIYKCLLKYGYYLDNTIPKETMINEVIKSHVPVVKKNGLTQNIIFINQLSLISGVSTKTAKVIANQYKTMYDLLIVLKDNPEILSEIKVSGRRIGIKKSKRIHEGFFQTCST